MEANINIVITAIGEKLKTTQRLIKNKHEIYGKVQQTMKSKAASKEKMTAAQITKYQRFIGMYESLDMADRWLFLWLAEVKREILNEGADYSTIYDNLKRVNVRQAHVISGLKGVIETGITTLAEL